MPQCTAKSKRSGKRCKNNAVTGYEVCRMHGARGGAPKGSANAMTHGAYQSIYVEQLEGEERELYERTTAEANLDEEIRLVRFKLARLLGHKQDTFITPVGAVKGDIPENVKDKGVVLLVDQLRKLVEAKKRIAQGGEDGLGSIRAFMDALRGAEDDGD